MTTQDPYRTWLARRLDVEAPQDFSARVMERLASDRAERAQPASVERLLESRPLRIAVSAAAVVVGLSRFVYLVLQAELIAF